MVMISLSASPACGPRFLAGCASWLSSRACQCGPNAWQKSSNWQKSSTSRSNMDASPRLMAPTQKEEFKGDKGLASPQTRNSGDHNLRRDEGLAPPARARSRCPQHPSSAQAGRQLAAQCTAPLNEQRLVDGLMADAHGLIVREVDRQAASDLLRAPGSCPLPVFPRSMPTAFPGYGRAGNSSPAWSDNNASQSFLHIGSQGRIARKLRRFGTASGSLGVPLRRCRAILKTAAPGGGVAPQLSRDRRGRSSKPACNLHGAALRTKERDLLSLRK